MRIFIVGIGSHGYRGQEFDDLQSIRMRNKTGKSVMCEIKIRNVIAINDLWPSDVSEGFQNCNPVDAPTPMVTAEELGECKKKGEQGNEIRPRQLRCI